MALFTRPRPAPSSATGDATVPAPQVGDVRMDPDRLSAPGIVSVPHWVDRFRAVMAGHGDGRHGLLPDPECGHTPYTARIADQYGSTVDSEQLTLTRTLSHIDELTGRLTTEAEQLRGLVESLRGQVLELRPGDDRVDPALDMRRREQDLRRRQADQQTRIDEAESRIAAIERDLAGLSALRAFQITATAQRIDRARVTRQQLVDAYWRWFVRMHPEESAVRAGYPIPSVDRPAVTAAALTSTSATTP